jgi:hypothetical protein
VVQSNLQGSLLCTRAALPLMAQQSRGGHVFFVEGAGRALALLQRPPAAPPGHRMSL